MDLYFNPDFDENSKLLKFEDEEFHHIAKVMRHKVGDEVFVTNGNGLIGRIKIIDLKKSECVCEIVSIQHFEKPSTNLIALVPILHNTERFEFALEKITELGIGKIFPFCSDRTIKKNIKLERSKKIIISAIKQSFNPFLPELFEVISFDEILEMNFENSLLLYGNPSGEKLSKISTSIDFKKYRNIIIAVGPEGDFSNREIELLKSKNSFPINLGKNRLRSETALITLLAQLKLFLEE